MRVANKTSNIANIMRVGNLNSCYCEANVCSHGRGPRRSPQRAHGPKNGTCPVAQSHAAIQLKQTNLSSNFAAAHAGPCCPCSCKCNDAIISCPPQLRSWLAMLAAHAQEHRSSTVKSTATSNGCCGCLPFMRRAFQAAAC